MNDGSASVEELAAQLEAIEIDWEPRLREQPWRPRRRRKHFGL